MTALYGVVFPKWKPDPPLKLYALFFDKLYIPELDQVSALPNMADAMSPELKADIAFLREREFLQHISITDTTDSFRSPRRGSVKAITGVAKELGRLDRTGMTASQKQQVRDLFFDLMTRLIATHLDLSIKAVPICRDELRADPFGAGTVTTPIPSHQETVFRVAISSLPIPDQTCAFQDILDFKDEERHQQWAFRRFLNTLTTKAQSEAEIRDDINWTLTEYSKAMDRFKLKRSVSRVETYIIPAVETLEGLKLSSFLKGLLSIKKRKIELLEAEATAPGRECAYVFDARKRFAK